MREQRRLVLFFGSSSCAGFTVLTVQRGTFTLPPSLVHIFTSLSSFPPGRDENEPSPAKVDKEGERRDTEKVSFVVVLVHPTSLTFLFLVHIFTSLSSFQPGGCDENEPSPTKVDEEGERQDTEKVSFVVVLIHPTSLTFLFLVHIFTSLSSFQPGGRDENEPSPAKVDEEGERRDTEKVSFVVVTPHPLTFLVLVHIFTSL